MEMAERVGFEPTVRLHAQRFSRPSRSTTLAPLRGAGPKGPKVEGRYLHNAIRPHKDCLRGLIWMDFPGAEFARNFTYAGCGIAWPDASGERLSAVCGTIRITDLRSAWMRSIR